jgi:hypothetical protein
VPTARRLSQTLGLKEQGIDAMKLSAHFFIAALSCISPFVFAGEPEGAKIKCSEVGRAFSADFKKEYVREDTHWGNPEFHYSSALETCLVLTEVVDGLFDKDANSVWYYRRVTDIYSNKVLAYSRYFISKNDQTKKETLVSLGNVGAAVNLSSASFFAAKEKLFSQ